MTIPIFPEQECQETDSERTNCKNPEGVVRTVDVSKPKTYFYKVFGKKVLVIDSRCQESGCEFSY